eukprot:g4386.t1
MTAQAFAPAGRTSASKGYWYRHHALEFKHGGSPDQLRPATTRVEATQQQNGLDGDIWWDGDIDPWMEAKSRALMKQFKDSVLDEDGLSVRALSEQSARRAADQAAGGMMDLAEREFRSRLPPPASRSSLYHPDDSDIDLDLDLAAVGRIGVDSAATTADGAARGEANVHARLVGETFPEGGGANDVDWGDADEITGGGNGSMEGGAAIGSGVARPVLESVGDRAEYESTLAALKAYRRQHGNLLLTQNYVMPCDEEEGGMREHRGWRLGQKAYNMKFWKRHVRDRPSRREELAALGFVWGRLQDEYNLFVEALLAYKEIEGSLLVPHSFVVPEGGPWPLCCQGMRLGAKVSGVRNQSLYVRTDVARWYQLDAMGFVWDLTDAPFRQVYDALLQYKALHGNLNVPVAFCVPSSPPWHQDLWGLALGQRVLDIRAKHRYIRNDPERIRLLNKAGFRWADAAKASYVNVVRALKAYRKVKGRDLSVASSFVVPSFLPWPQSCWGLRLGTALVDIRSKGRYLKGKDSEERRQELERLGVFAQSREAILANVVKGLRSYLEVVGDTMVPQGFVVPDGEAWPQECRGQKLGWMLYGLRRRPERLDRHPEVRAELTALGFSWEVPRKGSRGPRKRQASTSSAAPTAAPSGRAAAGVDGRMVVVAGGGGGSGVVAGVDGVDGEDGAVIPHDLVLNALQDQDPAHQPNQPHGSTPPPPPRSGMACAAPNRDGEPGRVAAGGVGLELDGAGRPARSVAQATGPQATAAPTAAVDAARPPEKTAAAPNRARARGLGDSARRKSGVEGGSARSGGTPGPQRRKRADRGLAPAARWLLEESGGLVGGARRRARGSTGPSAAPGAHR